MKSVIQAIKDHELSKEYLELTGAIADIDEQLNARSRKSFWQLEESQLTPKQRALLEAERMLLAKALMDVVGRINGVAECEASPAKIGITVDINLPAAKTEDGNRPKSLGLKPAPPMPPRYQKM